jgi:nitroimidazol reductase NimA-like FMN-containing flavoprotein (pyridoxamine 5'-phosphate oxidase superfamily)
MTEQAQQTVETEPRADRPQMPEGYGVPESAEGLLPWSFARAILDSALLYWVGTTRPDGRPHAVPIWGVWLDDAFWFEGGPDTRRGRNLATNPAIAVHVERGDDVVIVEGNAQHLAHPAPALATRLADAFGTKYEPKNYRPDPASWDEGGLYCVEPHVVLAWSHFPADCTRWHFPVQ